MDPPPSYLTDFSLKEAFISLLQYTVMHCGYAHPTTIETSLIALKRVKHDQKLIYSSAIALKLAGWSDQPAHEIAHCLGQTLQNQTAPGMHGLKLLDLLLPQSSVVLAGVSIQTTDTGLLQLIVQNQAIAAWLNGLLQTPLALPTASPTPPQLLALSEEQQFEIQHAHARCCSLLKLAEQQGLIHLTQHFSEMDPFPWSIALPESLPWLTSNGDLVLIHAADCQLIQALVTAIDDIATPILTSKRDGRQAFAFCQAFQAMHRVHPLLADKTPVALPAIVAYLALVQIARQILFYYLNNQLNLPAPTQL
ncbi:MAG TPA: hypothetical protein V6C46_00425 [Coleofasciculaceae cyanobacterium]